MDLSPETIINDIIGLTIWHTQDIVEWLNNNGVAVEGYDFAFYLYYTAAAILVSTILLCCFCRRSGARKSQKGSALLIWGPSGAGKTSLFYQLREESFPKTITSMTANEDKITIGNKQFQTIDYPGHQRMRDGLMNNYLRRAGVVVYVVDASNLKSELSHTAHGLYDLLTRSYISNAAVPVVVACNKSDDPTAVSADTARKMLETELNKLRATKATNLGLTNVQEQDDSDSVAIGVVGKPFKFDDLEHSIDFVACSCYKGDVEALKSVIADI